MKRTNTQKLTEIQMHEIIPLYKSGKSLLQIATQLGITHQTVRYHLKKQGVARRTKSEGRRKCNLNESVFDSINEESAYWVGFLMADGNIHIRPKSSPRIKLELQKRDIEHVRLFKKFIQSTHRIYNNHGNTAISFSSSKIAESLAGYGVTPRKSLTAKVYKLENNRHFWRGMVDGDGCISDITSGQKKRLQLIGSKNSMEQFAEFVESNTNQPKPAVRQRGNIYVVELYHRRAEIIISLLYRDCTIALSRKSERAKRIIEADIINKEYSINSAELGRCIKQKRRGEKLTLEELARKIRVSKATLSRIENGRIIPFNSTLSRLAVWLGDPPKNYNPTSDPDLQSPLSIQASAVCL